MVNKQMLVEEAKAVLGLFRVAGENLLWALIALAGLIYKTAKWLGPKIEAALKSGNFRVDIVLGICLAVVTSQVFLIEASWAEAAATSMVKGWDISENLRIPIVNTARGVALLFAVAQIVTLGYVLIHEGVWKPSPKWLDLFEGKS